MVKINTKWVDAWSIPHFIAGVLFGRYTDLNIIQFSVINVGFEVFEALLKKQYDVFNIPFGRETVLECGMNSVCDVGITTGGFLTGRLIKVETFRPMLEYLKENHHEPLVGVEIGVFHGNNSLRILQMLPIKHLYLVDPFEDYPDYNTPLIIPSGFDIALSKLEPFYDRITPLQMKSKEASGVIPNELDFVYIDGNHSYEYVKKDIETYYPKIRVGGVIGGHDITDNLSSEDIRRAASEFAVNNNKTLSIKSPDWWIIK